MSSLTSDRRFKSATAIARWTWRSFHVLSNLWLVVTFSCVASLGGDLDAAERATHPKALTPSESPTAILDLVRDSAGVMTPALRDSYVDWSKNKLLSELKSTGEIVPEDALHEIESDSTLSDAVFASVYPPDKTILHNYIELRSKLGATFVRKYRSLIVAAAVAHRRGGVTDRDLSDEEQPDPEDLEVDSAELPDSPLKDEVAKA
jgi:hypothetical protein